MPPKKHEQPVQSEIHHEIGWNKAGEKKVRSQKDINNEMRKGNVESEAKVKHTGKAGAWKIEEESENFRHNEITSDFKMALMQARTAKGWKQKDLAQQVQQPPAVIQSYENGTAIPDGQVINRLNRALGITLPKVNKPNKKPKD